MDWNFLIYTLLLSVSQSVVAFNIDSNPWRSFSNSESAFGYKVIQKDFSNLLISSPLEQHQNTRGRIYNCPVQRTCSPLQINVPYEAVNMSLGLSMSKSPDPQSSKIVVCGPTIPKDCKTMTTYNGMCFTLDNNREERVPKLLRDCPKSQIDIAFLMDGSGSVNRWDFETMKNFVISMIQGLENQDLQFAVAQYSYNCIIHVDFTSNLDVNTIKRITQLGGGTHTANGINTLVDLFISNGRLNANRVMIVITDGESTSGNLWDAAEYAKNKNIIRYAIGVGRAFNNQRAENELNIIASDPDKDYKFKVGSFDVLEQIRKTLEKNIIAIEGTQISGDSTRLEFAQDGFSAALLQNGNIVLSAVGAYQWKGGFQEYSSGKPYTFMSGNKHDSYLGYSMTVVTLPDVYIVLGAPRHEHKGKVVLSSIRTGRQIELDPPQPQIGAYYGAEVCAVDLNSDRITDLLLVSAPLYSQENREGKVFVYYFPNYPPRAEFLGVTLEGISGQKGRFGSSLASPADLDGDNIRDVVVGAPLEEDGRGSIYIFNGRSGNINPTYSQRIRGSSVKSDLYLFGLSLSESSLDHSGDALPDIAVGFRGGVTLLRSRPIVSLETRVTYNPLKISTKNTDCSQPLENTLTLCFTMKGRNTQISDLAANVNYTLKLDGKRQGTRAYFIPKDRSITDQMRVGLQEKCADHKFTIEACTEDALNPLSNELIFTFEGLPIKNKENLKPVLLPSIRNSSDHNIDPNDYTMIVGIVNEHHHWMLTLDFEINCGPDNICTDNLKVDFNFSGHSDIKVGIMQDMNVTIFVENRGENSYNSHVMLKYPFGLSFRRFTSKQGRVECVSVDSDEKVVLGVTTCYISKPIFRENSQAVFEITYSIDKDSNFDRTVTFNATAASGNDKHDAGSELSKTKTIGVKYAIYVALIRHESSSIHINFTAGKPDLHKPISQIFKVENDLRDVNLTVLIRVPVKLGDKNIWTNENLQIENCNKVKDEPPTVSDYLTAVKKHLQVNCSVATCRLFSCQLTILRREMKLYNISAQVSSDWITQTGLKTAVFELVSTATLDYDQNKYVYFSSDSKDTAPISKITTQVEVYEEKNMLKEIIGGAVGGLLLLALITAGLYKAGFFKSQYKQMLEEAGDEGPEAGSPEGGPAPAE